MFTVAALGIMVCMVLAISRALLGPTVYDRILAANMFGTKTVLIIAILGFLVDRPDFLDIAIVYAMINFVGVIAVLKFIRYGDLGWPHNLIEHTTNSNEPADHPLNSNHRRG